MQVLFSKALDDIHNFGRLLETDVGDTLSAKLSIRTPAIGGFFLILEICFNVQRKIFYYYLYYRIYHFAIKISDDALNEIKPGATIIILEILITQCFIWLQIFHLLSSNQEDLLWANPFLISIVLALVGYNYYVFLYQDKWKKYNHEFKSYAKRKILLWNTVIAGVIFIIIFGFIWHFIYSTICHRNKRS